MTATTTTARTFQYSVYDASGKVVKGRIEATTPAAVAGRLRSMGLAPIQIEEVVATGLQREVRLPGSGGRVRLKDLAVMSRQMATMISAGLSLLRVLGILAEQTESKPLAAVLSRVRSQVETGVALSQAMAQHPDVFPPLMVNLVRAGETGGFLERSLVSIAENYESEVKLRAQVKSAMTYPVVVFVFAIVAVTAMLLFVVPVFEDMFSSFGGQLPLPTLVLVKLSAAMRVGAPALLVAAVAAGAWWRRHRHDDAVRSRVQPLTLRLPVFGPLFAKVAISRFTRNFGTMLGAGVPILQALDIVGETSGSWPIEVAVRDIQENVRTGRALAAPMARHAVFPPMVVQMVATGEDSGAMEVMLHKISEFYDAEVEATTSQLTSLIEPLMIAVLGSVIGSMIIALYMPMFSIMQYVE